MCGRYTYYSSEEIIKEFDLMPNEDFQTALELPDNYNVSPGNKMPVIIRGSQEHILEYMVWGLVPAWSKTATSKLKLINARKEGLLEKSMWKRLVQSKRCIIPARGFYEWQKEGTQKLPFYITPKQGTVFSFAGLWDEWKDGSGTVLKTFTIITTTPNKEMTAVHSRMPAILTKEQVDIWLQASEISADLLDDILTPARDGSLVIVRVGSEVNNARNNSKDLIYPL